MMPRALDSAGTSVNDHTAYISEFENLVLAWFAFANIAASASLPPQTEPVIME